MQRCTRCSATFAGMMLGLAMNLTGCNAADLTRQDASAYPRTRTTAIAQSTRTAIGASLADDVKRNPGMSGFRLLTTGTDSLQYRLALIQAAEETIDLQYYTIHDDITANLLLEALLRAAERGVRVRFLIDNISMDEVGRSLSVLDGAKNVEIRIFNPPATRHQSWLGQITSRLIDVSKMLKRMHNKALIADNQLAIIGGRNLGDEYFEAHPDSNFKDVDLLTAGPITDAISRSFDAYWNGQNTFPIATVRTPSESKEDIEKLRAELKAHWQKELQKEDGRRMLESHLAEQLKKGDVGLLWAKAELRFDAPDKIEHDADTVQSQPLRQLQRLTENAREEFIVVSPYFVPQDEGVEWLADLVKRGVKVRVLTNSLASTDVVLVHTGYRDYREALLKNGIELYEFKAVGDRKPRQRLFGGSAPATASLHAKMYVVDRKSVSIGSFNLDPRSRSLNTEIALVVHHKTLAGQVVEMFEEAIAPTSSYRLSLDADGDMVWTTEEDGETETFRRDPDAYWRKVQAFLMGMLPVEDQL